MSNKKPLNHHIHDDLCPYADWDDPSLNISGATPVVVDRNVFACQRVGNYRDAAKKQLKRMGDIKEKAIKQVKRVTRQWPTCSHTGEPVNVHFKHEWNDGDGTVTLTPRWKCFNCDHNLF